MSDRRTSDLSSRVNEKAREEENKGECIIPVLSLSSYLSGCTRANPIDETITASIPNFQIDPPPVDPAYFERVVELFPCNAKTIKRMMVAERCHITIPLRIYKWGALLRCLGQEEITYQSGCMKTWRIIFLHYWSNVIPPSIPYHGMELDACSASK